MRFCFLLFLVFFSHSVSFVLSQVDHTLSDEPVSDDVTRGFPTDSPLKLSSFSSTEPPTSLGVTSPCTLICLLQVSYHDIHYCVLEMCPEEMPNILSDKMLNAAKEVQASGTNTTHGSKQTTRPHVGVKSSTQKPELKTTLSQTSTKIPRSSSRKPWKSTEKYWKSTKSSCKPTKKPWKQVTRPWKPSRKPWKPTTKLWKSTQKPWKPTRNPWSDSSQWTNKWGERHEDTTSHSQQPRNIQNDVGMSCLCSAFLSILKNNWLLILIRINIL